MARTKRRHDPIVLRHTLSCKDVAAQRLLSHRYRHENSSGFAVFKPILVEIYLSCAVVGRRPYFVRNSPYSCDDVNSKRNMRRVRRYTALHRRTIKFTANYPCARHHRCKRKLSVHNYLKFLSKIKLGLLFTSRSNKI